MKISLDAEKSRILKFQDRKVNQSLVIIDIFGREG